MPWNRPSIYPPFVVGDSFQSLMLVGSAPPEINVDTSSHSVEPSNGNHFLDFGFLIFLPQSFWNNIPRIALMIAMIEPKSSLEKSSANKVFKLLTSEPIFSTAFFAVEIALTTVCATSRTLEIASVMLPRILSVTPCTLDAILDVTLVTLLTTIPTIWSANPVVSVKAP